MKEHIVLLNYPRSYWGADIVRFIFDDYIMEDDLENVFEFAKADICAEDYDCIQDYADAICKYVVNELNGRFEYVRQSCVIDISKD